MLIMVHLTLIVVTLLLLFLFFSLFQLDVFNVHTNTDDERWLRFDTKIERKKLSRGSFRFAIQSRRPRIPFKNSLFLLNSLLRSRIPFNEIHVLFDDSLYGACDATENR